MGSICLPGDRPGAPVTPRPYGGDASGEREGGGHERVGRHRAAASAALPRPASAGPARRRRGAAGQRRRHGRRRPTAASSSGCCCSSSPARRPGSPLRAARSGLRSSEEMLAACAAGLAGRRRLAGRPRAGRRPGHRAAPRRRLPGAAPGRPDDRRLAAGLLGRGAARRAAGPATWCRTPCTPSSTSASPSSGLGIALFGRRVVGRLALLTTAPWWLAGRGRRARRAPGPTTAAGSGSPLR